MAAKHFPVPEWGSTYTATSYLDVTSSASKLSLTTQLDRVFESYSFDDLSPKAKFSIPAGTNGKIGFALEIHYHLINPRSTELRSVIKEGTLKYAVEWIYRCTAEGNLTLSPPIPGKRFWNSPISMTVGLNTWEGESRRHLAATVDLSLAEDTPATTTVGFAVEGVPVSASYTPGITASGKAGRLPTYFIDLTITDIPAPKPVPSSPVPSLDLERTIYFEKEGRDDLDKNVIPGNTLRDLQDWVEGIKYIKKRTDVFTDLFKAISSQYIVIHLRGYASKTDSDGRNFDLSEARVRNLKKRLEAMFGTPYGKPLLFDPVSRGKREASQQDVPPRERDTAYLKDRRVRIYIDKAEALAGIARVVKGAP